MNPRPVFRPERLLVQGLGAASSLFEHVDVAANMARALVEPFVGLSACRREGAGQELASEGPTCVEPTMARPFERCDGFRWWKRPRLSLLDVFLPPEERPCVHWWDVERESRSRVESSGLENDAMEPPAFRPFRGGISLRIPSPPAPSSPRLVGSGGSSR